MAAAQSSRHSRSPCFSGSTLQSSRVSITIHDQLAALLPLNVITSSQARAPAWARRWPRCGAAARRPTPRPRRPQPAARPGTRPPAAARRPARARPPSCSPARRDAAAARRGWPPGRPAARHKLLMEAHTNSEKVLHAGCISRVLPAGQLTALPHSANCAGEAHRQIQASDVGGVQCCGAAALHTAAAPMLCAPVLITNTSSRKDRHGIIRTDEALTSTSHEHSGHPPFYVNRRQPIMCCQERMHPKVPALHMRSAMGCLHDMGPPPGQAHSTSTCRQGAA